MANYYGKEREVSFSPEATVSAIKYFLSQYKDFDFRKSFDSQVDVSGPHTKDLDAIAAGDYEIRSLSVNPELLQIHFYVGQTEFHLSGQAVQYILDYLRK